MSLDGIRDVAKRYASNSLISFLFCIGVHEEEDYCRREDCYAGRKLGLAKAMGKILASPKMWWLHLPWIILLGNLQCCGKKSSWDFTV